MEKIYSKVEDGELLHILFKKEEINKARTDISPENQYLQLSALNLNKGKTFRPHKHIIHEKITDRAQESWVVIQGKVKAILFDLDDNVIREAILEPGDISITFNGGHNYEILEDNTLVYEYKTGPYLGQEFDKVFI